ncbi:dihydrofolate reductase family protein [Glutamicibacter sp. X7]
MAKVIVHATMTLDGFIADKAGGVDWMFGRPSAPEDDKVVENVMNNIGAIIGGANKTQTIEPGEIPYGGMIKAPVFLMTHTPHEPIEFEGVTYKFVVDDIASAVKQASLAADDKWVSLLGGSISRQCLQLGLVDELHLDIASVLLGEGISLFSGLEQPVELVRLETAAFASETHLIYRVVR